MSEQKAKYQNFYNLKNKNFLRNRLVVHKDFPLFNPKYLSTTAYQNLHKNKHEKSKMVNTTTKISKNEHNNSELSSKSDSNEKISKKNSDLYIFFKEKIENQIESKTSTIFKIENFNFSKRLESSSTKKRPQNNEIKPASNVQILSNLTQKMNSNKKPIGYLESRMLPSRGCRSQSTKYRSKIREKSSTKHENNEANEDNSNFINFLFPDKNETKNKKIPDIQNVIFEDLMKKELPNSLGNFPLSRKEILLLIKWFDSQIETISLFYKDKDIEEEKFHKQNELFDVLIKEIVREVNHECNERGNLLSYIWDTLKKCKHEEIDFFIKKNFKIKELEKIDVETIKKFSLENIEKAHKDRDAFREKYYESSIQAKIIEEELEKNQKLQKEQVIKLDKYKNKLKKFKIELIKLRQQLRKTTELKEFKIKRSEFSHSNNNNKIPNYKSEESIESDDENFDIKIDDGKTTNYHKIELLNNIIIHTVPEIPKKFFLESSSQITNDFYNSVYKSIETNTEISITENLNFFNNSEEFEKMILNYHLKEKIENYIENCNENNENELSNFILAIKNDDAAYGLDFNIDEKLSLQTFEDLKFINFDHNFDSPINTARGNEIQNIDSMKEIGFSEAIANYVSTPTKKKAGNNKKGTTKSPIKEKKNLETLIEKKQQEINMAKLRNKKLRFQITSIMKILRKLFDSYKLIFENNKNLEEFNVELKNTILNLKKEIKENKKNINILSAEKWSGEQVIEKISKNNSELIEELEKYKKIEKEEEEKRKLQKKSNSMKDSKKLKKDRVLISPLHLRRKKKEIESEKKEKEIENEKEKEKETGATSKRSLGDKIHIEYEHQKRDIAKQLINKVKKNYMHLKLIFKQITVIYLTRLQHYQDLKKSKNEEKLLELNEFDMATYTYTVFLKIHGSKTAADDKFIIFLLSLKKYLNYFRINFFARFLGLLDYQANYSTEECNKYIEALEYILYQSTMGTSSSIVNNESDDQFFVPYLKALQYLSQYDNKMNSEEFFELKGKIEKIKDEKENIINFDRFMHEILTKYRALVSRAKGYVINAFSACDLDGNEEFTLLNRHIEADTFDEEKIEKMFYENSDIEQDGEKNLSFDKFSIVCVEHNLFSDEKQNLYLGIKNKNELQEQFNKLKANWGQISQNIKYRLEALTVITKEEIDKWMEICDVLNNKILEDHSEVKPLLIAFNILEKESIMLFEEQIDYDENIDS